MDVLRWAPLIEAIGTCVAGIVVAVTLILLWRQNKSLERSIRSSTYQLLQPNEAAYSTLLINYPEVEKIIYSEDYEEGEINTTSVRAYWAALLLLTFMENVCVQHEDFGLIPAKLWRTWEAYMRHDFQRYSFIRKVWSENKEIFAHIEKFMSSQEGI